MVHFWRSVPVSVTALIAVAVGLFVIRAPVRITNNDPLVWQARDERWLRDPNIFDTDAGTFILSGTRPHIIEYQSLALGFFEYDDGKAELVRLFSPNGKRNLRENGYREWEKQFFRGSDGLRMIASLPTVKDFDADLFANAGRRSTYIFVPMADGRKTASGFPLDWKLSANKPFIRDVYHGGVFETGGETVFVYADVRNDKKINTTCIQVQSMSRKLETKGGKFLLCPGRRVRKEKDTTGWNRNTPFPSEVRFSDGGGLVEGAWVWLSPKNKYYLLYSSGDYQNPDLCEVPLDL